MVSLLLGTALWFTPAPFVTRLRGIFLDTLRPGLACASGISETLIEQQQSWQTTEIQQLTARLQESERNSAQQTERARRLAVWLADLRDRPPSVVPDSIDRLPPLFTPALISGRVLGASLSQAWRTGVVFDRGWPAGVREAAMVVQSPSPLIDLGEPQQLSPEDPLIVGRVILGKVAVVGRWTSTYLPVTDPEFRGPAQLLHVTDQGTLWGAKGIVQGLGRACELRGISGTATVRVGDDVFTADRDGMLEAPLYYGRVTSAELTEDGREWTVIVEPAPRPTSNTQVQVLRAALNPQRIVAH